MAMSAAGLAEEIRSQMGLPSPPSAELKGWSKGLISGITKGIATFGGIPGPHLITALIPAAMAAEIANEAGYDGVTPQLLDFCTGITTYLMMSAFVFYQGPPPPAVPNFNVSGKITGLSGPAMAALVASQSKLPGVSEDLQKMCTAIANHIQNNAQVESGVVS